LCDQTLFDIQIKSKIKANHSKRRGGFQNKNPVERMWILAPRFYKRNDNHVLILNELQSTVWIQMMSPAHSSSRVIVRREMDRPRLGWLKESDHIRDSQATCTIRSARILMRWIESVQSCERERERERKKRMEKRKRRIWHPRALTTHAIPINTQTKCDLNFITAIKVGSLSKVRAVCADWCWL